jgi:hypothetical protein
MGDRFRDSTTWPDRWPVLVRCPRCDGCARVVPVADAARRSVVRLTCPACALVREGRSGGPAGGELRIGPEEDGRTWRDPQTREISTWPDTPEQVHPLWLRASCCGGELLWAANEAHLAYLEDYIAAELRERPEAVISPMGRRWVGKGLSWQLPDWMKAAKHRAEVLATLSDLRSTLPAGENGGDPG